jgi:hypothetical protein
MSPSRVRFLQRVKENLAATYPSVDFIMRDPRLRKIDQIELLRLWPAKDDFDRGRIATLIAEIEAERKADHDDAI